MLTLSSNLIISRCFFAGTKCSKMHAIRAHAPRVSNDAARANAARADAARADVARGTSHAGGSTIVFVPLPHLGSLLFLPDMDSCFALHHNL